MFFAALAQVLPGLEPDDGDGFVIITAESVAVWSTFMTGALSC